MPTRRSISALFWAMAILLIIGGDSYSAAKSILKVDVVNNQDKVVITATANSRFSVSVFKSAAGRFVGFECKGVLLNAGKQVPVHSGKIRNVKYSSFRNSPPTSRIVVNTVSSADYTLNMSSDKQKAVITVWKQAYKETPAAKKIEAASEEAELVAKIDVPAAKAVTTASAVKATDKLPALGDKAPAIAAVAPVQIAKVQIKPVVAKPKAVARPQAKIVRVSNGNEPKISLSFADTEIVDVLKALALQSGRNIVVSKAVGGKITLNLNNVTPEQALNYVTKMSGFAFVKQGQTYLVATRSSLLGLATNEDLNIKIEAIMLSYASPNDVISIVQNRFPDLKIRKSDTRWRILPLTTPEKSTVTVKSESGKAVGQAQGQKGDSQSSGGSDSGSDSSSKDKDSKNENKESRQTQAGVEFESSSFVDEVNGREEQTKSDSNMLIISGPAPIVEQAAELINEIEKSVYDSVQESTFEVYKIKNVQAVGLAEALRQLVPGIIVRRAPQPGVGSMQDPVEGDPIQATDRAIIICGRQKDVGHALEIVAKLDVADSLNADGSVQADRKQVVELITIKNVNGEDVLKAISQHYPSLKANMITALAVKENTQKTAKEDKNKLPEQTGSVMILSGPQNLIAEAKGLVAQMDSALRGALYLPENSDSKEQTSMKKYEVKFVNALELATSLRTLIPTVTVSFAPSEGFDLEGPGAISISADTGASVAQAARAARVETSSSKETISTTVRTLLLLGNEAEVQRALELAANLDVKSPQIKITAKVTSITESGEKNLGLTWDWGALNYREQGSTGAWIRDAVDFGAKLEALYTSGDIQILATPSMTILDGKPGVFFVGDEVTYITLIQQTPTGQNVVTEKAVVGIQLKLNGRVSSDGSITLNLHPEVSTLKLNETSVSGVTLPIVSRRFTDQVVRVKDGETYVVGGLIRNDDLSEMTKIPLLGDIPFFGNLFRHSQKTKQRTEVVMFITANILRD